MVIRKILATACLLGVPVQLMADGPQARPRDTGRCRVEVLHSEELPIGPLFHHTVKATFLITSPDEHQVIRSVEKVIPWQVPPPRRGQKLSLPCDSMVAGSFFGLE